MRELEKRKELTVESLEARGEEGRSSLAPDLFRGEIGERRQGLYDLSDFLLAIGEFPGVPDLFLGLGKALKQELKGVGQDGGVSRGDAVAGLEKDEATQGVVDRGGSLEILDGAEQLLGEIGEQRVRSGSWTMTEGTDGGRVRVAPGEAFVDGAVDGIGVGGSGATAATVAGGVGTARHSSRDADGTPRPAEGLRWRTARGEALGISLNHGVGRQGARIPVKG